MRCLILLKVGYYSCTYGSADVVESIGRNAVLVRMDIKSVIVAGGPIPSLVTLAPRHQADGIERELPIRIGVVEAAAISTGVDGTQERPKTHDLLLTTIRRLGATLTGVAIVDVRGTTFYANLLLEDTQGVSLTIDCRPSDAIALAVRAGVPVFAEDHVLECAVMPDFAAVEREEKDREIAEFHDFVETLSADDFDASSTAE